MFKTSKGGVLLFDVVNDPTEQNDLASRFIVLS